MRSLRLVLPLALAVLAGCQSSVNLDVAREFPCDRDAGIEGSADGGVCPTGFRCGVDNTCHSTTVGAAIACAGNDDCVTGWRCGVNNVCTNLDAGIAYGCRNADDSYCSSGWRCGLDNTCHSRDAGAPYPCVPDGGAGSDTYCEKGWRCDLVSGTCTEAANNGFSPPAYNEGFKLDYVSPQMPDGPPSHFAVGRTSFQGGGNDHSRVIAEMTDYGLAYLRYRGDSSFGEAPAELFRLRNLDQRSVKELVALESSAVVSLSDGGVISVIPGEDGGLVVRPVPGGPYSRLRATDYIGVDQYDRHTPQDLLALSNGQVHLLSEKLDAGTTLPVDGGVLVDAIAKDDRLWVAGSRGVFQARLPVVAGASGQLLPVIGWPGLETAGCLSERGDGGTSFSIVRLHHNPVQDVRENFLVAEATRVGVTTATGRGTHLAVSEPNDRIGSGPSIGCYGIGRSEGPCPACPDGQPLLDVQLVYTIEHGEERIRLQVRCPASAARNEPELTYIMQMGGSAVGCAQTWTPTADFVPYDRGPFVSSRNSGGVAAFAGAYGTAWLRELENLKGGQPFLLDARPESLLRVDPSIASGIVVVTRNRFFNYSPGIGFVAEERTFLPGDPQPAASVAGFPHWVISADGQVLDVSRFNGEFPASLAAIPEDAVPPRRPFNGARAVLSDGRTMLLVSASDTLYAADITTPLRDRFARPSPLEVKLVPIPGSPITSFATLDLTEAPASETKPLLSGYALTASTLFYFAALTLDRWEIRPIDMSGVKHDWVKVWSEKWLGRIGFNNGSIYALRSRVPIAEPIPVQDVKVMDYARLCGNTFALTTKGVFRLSPTSASTPANWVATDHNPNWPEGLDGSRFYRLARNLPNTPPELFIASPRGKVARIVPSNPNSPECGD
ncbi:MAG TPA: hypothetical protein VK447_16815 [Myxococcaceae bacterium]|nr:hypothetical protein [Myxococcaceae bacterium]